LRDRRIVIVHVSFFWATMTVFIYHICTVSSISLISSRIYTSLRNYGTKEPGSNQLVNSDKIVQSRRKMDKLARIYHSRDTLELNSSPRCFCISLYLVC
jgi:hypothetical protein